MSMIGLGIGYGVKWLAEPMSTYRQVSNIRRTLVGN